MTANRATRYHEHSNSRICTPVLVQAGPGCKNMYTATQGAFVYDSHPLGGKTVHISVMGRQDSTYRCTYPGGQKKMQ